MLNVRLPHERRVSVHSIASPGYWLVRAKWFVGTPRILPRVGRRWLVLRIEILIHQLGYSFVL